MPKCSESWDKCSGFLDCAAAAAESAYKCAKSAAKEVAKTTKEKVEGLEWDGSIASDYFSQTRDYYRAACKQDVLCSFNAWKAVKADAKTVGPEFDPKPLFDGSLYDSYFDASGEFKAKYLGWPKIWPLLTPSQQKAWELLVAHQLEQCGTKYNKAADLKSLGAVPVVGSILDATANLAIANQGGYCLKKAEGLTDRDLGVELLGEVTLTIAKASGLAPVGALTPFGADWKKCVASGGTDKEACQNVDVTELGKQLGAAAMNEILKEFGLELPPEVVNVLDCIATSMGAANVAAAAFQAVTGDAEKAAKAFAPHVIKCAGQEAINKLGPGPLQSVLKKALAIAVALAAPAPTPPPTGPVLDCSVAGFNAYANAGDKASLVACYATQGIYGEQANQLADLFVKSNKLVPTQLAQASWLGDLTKVELPKKRASQPVAQTPALALLVVGGLLLAASAGGGN